MRCQVTVTTVVDGKKTRVVHTGDMEISARQAVIYYIEENARVTVRMQERRVSIVREGDYTLAIRLEKGKTLDGSIGIGDNVGNIQTQTERIAYQLTEEGLTLLLKYVLLAGEPQNMQVKIEAKGV